MNKEVFIDADIVLDLLCKREPFYSYAAEVFTMGRYRHNKTRLLPHLFSPMFSIF
jgi:hypothetical protein